MPLVRCPNCAVVTVVSDEETDFEHQCNSGHEALDFDSVVMLDTNVSDLKTVVTSNAVMNGQANKASVAARLDGVHTFSYNRQGEPEQTHFQRQHFEFIELEGLK